MHANKKKNNVTKIKSNQICLKRRKKGPNDAESSIFVLQVR